MPFLEMVHIGGFKNRKRSLKTFVKGCFLVQTIHYVITDENGIHARPAGLFVKAAAGFASDIKIAKDSKEADAKRLFGVMGLGVKQGDEIVVTVNGADETKAAEALESFLKANL